MLLHLLPPQNTPTSALSAPATLICNGSPKTPGWLYYRLEVKGVTRQFHRIFRVILYQSISPGAAWRAIDSLYLSVYMERSRSTAWHFRKHRSLTGQRALPAPSCRHPPEGHGGAGAPLDTADWYSDDSSVRCLRVHRGAPWVIAGNKLSSYWSLRAPLYRSVPVRPAGLPTVPTDSCLLQALAGLEGQEGEVGRGGDGALKDDLCVAVTLALSTIGLVSSGTPRGRSTKHHRSSFRSTARRHGVREEEEEEEERI
ncbi:unnamed protein product [Lota lota]